VYARTGFHCRKRSKCDKLPAWPAHNAPPGLAAQMETIQMKHRILGSLMLVLALVGCGEKVFGHYWQQGQERYEAGDYAGAFEKLYVLAEQGHAAAQGEIGMFYLMGWGVRQDIKKGFEWLDKSAEKGSATQKLLIGTIYFLGTEVKLGETERLLLEYIRSRLERKEARNSGEHLEAAPEKRKNHTKAAHWLAAAISHDDVNVRGKRISMEINAAASLGLGVIYSMGEYGMQDGEKAVYWFEFSVKEGCLPCAYFLARIHEDGKITEQNDEKAMYWYSWFIDHADHANDRYFDFNLDIAEFKNEALLALALMYLNGRGIDIDDDQGLSLLRLAAQNGSMEAQYRVGEIYLLGLVGVEADKQEALTWLRMAAEQGDADSQVMVEELLAEGIMEK